LTTSSLNSFVYTLLGALSMLTPPSGYYTATLVSTKVIIGQFVWFVLFVWLTNKESRIFSTQAVQALKRFKLSFCLTPARRFTPHWSPRRTQRETYRPLPSKPSKARGHSRSRSSELVRSGIVKKPLHRHITPDGYTVRRLYIVASPSPDKGRSDCGLIPAGFGIWPQFFSGLLCDSVGSSETRRVKRV